MRTFIYHVSCTDGKISVRIYLFLLPIFPLSSHSIFVFFFFSVGLSLFSQHSQQVLLFIEGSSVSWLVKLTVGIQITDYFNCWFRNFFCCLARTVDLNSNDQQSRPNNKRNFKTQQLKY